MSEQPDEHLHDCKADLAENAAIRGTLFDIVRRRWLSDDQIEQLIEEHLDLVDSLREHWVNPSPFQKYLMRSYERLALLLRHRPMHFEGHGQPAAVIFCLKCETFPIDIRNPCPVCRTSYWLDVTYI